MNAQLKPAPAADTPALDLEAVLQRQRAAHQRGAPDYAARVAAIRKLRAAFKARLEDFARAVSEDFGRRSRHETLIADGMTVLHDIDHTLKHLRAWMRPRRASVGMNFWPARAEIRYQPVGVVGVIAPWNYPINLALMPLVSALAAGNHVMLKPSRAHARTSALLQELLSALFPQEQVAVVLGDAGVAAAFSALPFDHLFFTGSTQVGKAVMAAAARHLTPVTLELGGKSPAIVAPDFPLEKAAARIGAGKFFNGGQTCIAPDYVLLPRARIGHFVEALRNHVAHCYGDLRESPDYTTVVNDRQQQRLSKYLDDARARGAQVIELAPGDASRRVFAPTVVLDAPDDALVMQEEIFGPILPLVACESVDQAIAYVNARPRPLALYHFDEDRARTTQVLDRTIAGGVTINDCLTHFAIAELPFGGIGPSGMGHYHGHAGFLGFSKQKPVFRQARWPATDWLRPPYRNFAERLVRFLTR